MSLRDIIAAYDDTALEALASKGLLRRAHKDMAAGRAEIVRFDADAEVMADGQTVTIPETGPARAACTCSANGICRHIVLALLALRGEAVSDGAAGMHRLHPTRLPKRGRRQHPWNWRATCWSR
ncbi:MAG: SWIM zinc finger family protein [Rhodobacteraceae bacterium]|nr:SWIM zinc finger family protein [Paracoccaceae bacterium]